MRLAPWKENGWVLLITQLVRSFPLPRVGFISLSVSHSLACILRSKSGTLGYGAGKIGVIETLFPSSMLWGPPSQGEKTFNLFLYTFPFLGLGSSQLAKVYPMYVRLEYVSVTCFSLACWVNLRGRLRGYRFGGTPGAPHTSRIRH